MALELGSLSEADVGANQPEGKQGHQQEHSMDILEICHMFETDAEAGLTIEQALQNRETYGENAYEIPDYGGEGIPHYIVLLRYLTSNLAMYLWAAAILCFIGYGMDKRLEFLLFTGAIFTSLATLGGCYYFYQHMKGISIKKELITILEQEFQIIRSGEERNVVGSEIVPGDVIRIVGGTVFPADIRLTECDRLVVENPLFPEALQTRETMQATRDFGLHELIQARNVCLFGGRAAEGEAKGIVIAINPRTALISKIEEKTIW
eukprot:CAMPEP_0170183754 /NCGR_PEP_ID=MMETSP0040_2-20121228/31613_1 /TAXON_ID=641309 /ORGANISM="Lotharella oceanica, Strain CCMP622" /LENGTH=263 /DNA_ID=CAMNT_0010429591 /DNA_START=58 /DNA_END=846 /DNA_ORIENTATION=-